MARLSSIVSLLAVAALLVADAYAYRTIVTTVEVEEENQGRCQHIRAREQLRICESFLRNQGNQWMGPSDLKQCCGELRNVEEQCRCDALHEIARATEAKQGSHRLQIAQVLPSLCQIRPQMCHF
ncbi:2S albumin-like [Momordica charantia]|uniref:2S albumin-like n=1 Tax=Momordica charantia TaxID=3673 RepID=A0A6J1DN35_MOMCH|nr:2S albumin-like [Momordica charantia]